MLSGWGALPWCRRRVSPTLVGPAAFDAFGDISPVRTGGQGTAHRLCQISLGDPDGVGRADDGRQRMSIPRPCIRTCHKRSFPPASEEPGTVDTGSRGEPVTKHLLASNQIAVRGPTESPSEAPPNTLSHQGRLRTRLSA